MIKKILIICILISIILVNTFNNKNHINNIISYKINIINSIPNYKKDNIIGKLIIKKININKPLYDINSKENTIEKNISIMKESIMPDNKNSIVFIAAHSGTGPIAFFKNLNLLELNDEIVFIYKNIEYKYVVNKIWEEKKNGYININKGKEDQLILTTCSPTRDKYQLIINCIKKES